MYRPLTMAAAIICLSLATISVSAPQASAGEWMFRRSYYSHAPQPGQEEEGPGARSVRREPWVGAHPRFAIRGAWRFNTFSIQNGSGSSDRTYFRESYFDANY
jgi:hypothetical protein